MIYLGCDPEFVITCTGKFLPAYHLLNEDGDFGLDGHTAIAEIRPQPAQNSFALIANIRSLIKRGIEEIPLLKSENINFLCGHYKFRKPLGGHIHISSKFLSENLYDDLYQRLDLVLLTLSNIIDDLEEREKRLDEGYGRGWRTANHGGLEYRSPGSWLLNPKVAFTNLFLAEIIVIEFIRKNSKIFNEFEEDKKEKEEKIIEFVNNSSMDKKIKIAALKIIEEVFKNIPLNWDEDFKGGWL